MNKTMFYYVSKNINVENSSFANTLVKRFDTFSEAEAYLKGLVEKWSAEGLTAKAIENDGEVWMAQATNDDYVVAHLYKIFATPVFMAGGSEEL